MNEHFSFDLDSDSGIWKQILARGLELADAVEFNVLYTRPGKELADLLTAYNGEILETSLLTRFYLSGGQRIRLLMSPKTKALLLQRSFQEWINFLIEDPALIRNDEEIVGTISHEMMCSISVEHFPKLVAVIKGDH